MRPPASMPIVPKTAGMTAAMMDTNPPAHTASATTSTQRHVTTTLWIDHPPADDRLHRAALELPSGERCVPPLGAEPFGLVDALGVGVHNRHVGVGPHGQCGLGEVDDQSR